MGYIFDRPAVRAIFLEKCKANGLEVEVKDDEFDTLEMYTTTPAAKIAVEKLRRYRRAQAVPSD